LKQRKIPLRKCVISNEQYPKQEMIRVVKDKEGNISVDTTGKANGRGAYLKLTKENVAKARQRRVLERQFEVKEIESVYAQLEAMTNE